MFRATTFNSSGRCGTSETTRSNSPTTFRILLQALRSSDGVIVFAGEDTVVVTSQSGSGQGQQVEIPIVYTGPRAKRIVIAPRDTALVSGTIAYRVTAYDSLGNVVIGVESRFFLVNPGDSTKLAVDRLTGVATTGRDSGQVRVYARTVDNAAYDTARVFADGWYRSGDLGHFDGEGHLYVVSRKTDMIISGGENIYPAEVESVLLECAAIEEACVVGKPDARWGEKVIAAVVVKAGCRVTRGEVMELFEGRLARYKHPKDVHFLARLPRTALGKVRKEDVRAVVSDGK